LRGEDGDDDIDAGAGLDDSNGGPGANTLLDADVSAVRLTNTLLRIDGITNRDHGFVSVVLFGTDGDTTVNAAGYTLGPIEVHAAGGSNSLTGGAGDDILESNGGLDTTGFLSGGAGNDNLYAQGNNNRLEGGPGDDLISVATGEVPVELFAGNVLIGGAGNDSIDGGGPGTVIEGGAGDDFIISRGGGGVAHGG